MSSDDDTPSAGFQLAAPYEPAGEQPQAIAALVDGFESGLARQTLLGVTGSGKTYTIEFSFAFQRLLPNLRRGDPFFELPDGTFFLIPEEWIARFADLAGVLQEQGELLRLPKSLYTVLQETQPDAGVGEFPVIDPEMIDYQPSENLQATLRP